MARFKTDQGVYITKSLFFETAPYNERQHVVYTLKSEDHNGLPSLKRLYLEEMDPTEYRFVEKHLGGWDHWKKLQDSEWFKPHLEAWRDELEIKMKSLAFVSIMSEAANPESKNKVLANKFIIESIRRIQKNEDLGDKTTRGRPNKSEVDKKALEMAQDSFNISQDAERVLSNKDLN